MKPKPLKKLPAPRVSTRAYRVAREPEAVSLRVPCGGGYRIVKRTIGSF